MSAITNSVLLTQGKNSVIRKTEILVDKWTISMQSDEGIRNPGVFVIGKLERKVETLWFMMNKFTLEAK